MYGEGGGGGDFWDDWRQVAPSVRAREYLKSLPLTIPPLWSLVMGKDQPKNANFQDSQVPGVLLVLPNLPPPETNLGKSGEMDRFILLSPPLGSPCPGRGG